MQRVRIKYKKGDALRFIGHLDVVRLWERAIRRTDVPLAYTEGYNPRQKLSFGPPLSLGITSDCEFIDIYLSKWVNPASVMEALNKVLPEGMSVVEAKNIFSGAASLSAVISTAEYSAEVSCDIGIKVKDILSLKEIMFERKDRKINIRPMIKDMSIVPQKDGSCALYLRVRCDNYGTLKASEICRIFEGYELKDLKRIGLS